jgi:hypothetical protein
MARRNGRAAGIVALLGMCLLLGQLHAAVHVRANADCNGTSALDCQACISSVWTAPAPAVVVEPPTQSLFLETLPEFVNASRGEVLLTSPRAPPLA